MTTRLMVLVLSLSLAACATPQVVQVPVAVPCPPPRRLARPQLPISDLQPGSTPQDVVKAYAISIEKLKGYAKELEEVLKGYRP